MAEPMKKKKGEKKRRKKKHNATIHYQLSSIYKLSSSHFFPVGYFLISLFTHVRLHFMTSYETAANTSYTFQCQRTCAKTRHLPVLKSLAQGNPWTQTSGEKGFTFAGNSLPKCIKKETIQAKKNVAPILWRYHNK